MTRGRGSAVALGLVVAMGAPSRPSGASEAEGCGRVTVRVWDRLPVPRETSERAQARVERTFRGAGVQIRWKDCASDPDPTCSTPGAGEISLRIFRRPLAERRRTGDSTGGVALRQPGAVGIVQLFYDRLEEVAAMRDLPMDLVLGTTTAHEIGHLLLRPGHSRTGIMQAGLAGLDWHRAAQGWLGFSAAETATMREAVCGPEAAR